MAETTPLFDSEAQGPTSLHLDLGLAWGVVFGNAIAEAVEDDMPANVP